MITWVLFLMKLPFIDLLFLSCLLGGSICKIHNVGNSILVDMLDYYLDVTCCVDSAWIIFRTNTNGN